jgi:hypothetical protein
MRKSFRRATCIFRVFFLCSSCHLFLCPLLPSLSNVQCPLSHVSALSPILCLLSYVSVPCLPSSGTCLTSLFLVSRPLVYVSRLCSLPSVRCPQSCLCSLSPVFCILSHVYVPCLPSADPSLCLCSLSPVLCILSHVYVPCLPSSRSTCLTSMFLVSHPLYPASRLCSLSPILCTLPHISELVFGPFYSVSCDLSSVSHPPSPSPYPYQLSQLPLCCGSIPLFLFSVRLLLLRVLSFRWLATS